MSNWISVKDRLPEKGQRCIIWDTNENLSCNGTNKIMVNTYMASFIEADHMPNESFDWCWKYGNELWLSQDVSHWMPLPESP